MEFLKSVGLADLHVHLGATMSPHFLWELAHHQGMRLYEKDYWRFIESVQITKKLDSKDYLKKVGGKKQPSPFVVSHRIQSSPYAIEECVHTAIAGAYRQSGVTLIELRFNPIFRSHNSEYDLDKIILGAVMGMRRATIEYPVKAGLIIESDRQFSKNKHLILARKAIKFSKLGVVGFDISGPTGKNFSIDGLIAVSSLVKKAGLGFTIHSGEFTDVKEIWQVVEKLHPDRIGHGIKAYRDQKLMARLAREKIVLELCPTSNIMTRVVANWQEMKKIITVLKQAGVLFVINSDGPEFLQTNVRRELELLYQKNILSKGEIRKVVSLAHRASFINNE